MIAFSNAISNGSIGALQVLSLGGNQIGNAGIVALVGVMGSMGELRDLYHEGNLFGDLGTVAFSEALGSGSLVNLSHLDLDENHISDTGMVAFAHAIKPTPQKTPRGHCDHASFSILTIIR